jgi:SAM-dependent methyltransferase
MVRLMPTDLEYLETHRRVWQAKPRLRECYRRYHDMLLDACPKDARVLELGCGIGTLAERARDRGHERWIATDILETVNARIRCSGEALPFAQGSLQRIVFVDVLHHIAHPHVFFREAARVLGSGGEIVCVEPWVTPLSYPIYRWIHHEGCDLSRDLDAPFAGSKIAYEGDNGIPSLLCRRLTAGDWQRAGFEPPHVQTFNDFAYLSTRGLRKGRDAWGPVFVLARLLLDRFLSPLAPLLGVRAFIRWRKLT